TAQRSWWSELNRTSAAHEIIRRAGNMSVHVVPEQLTRAMKGRVTPRLFLELIDRPFKTNDYAGSLAMVVGATIIGLLLQRLNIGPSNVGLMFLTAVFMSAIIYGRWPALLASVVSALGYNFTIADPANVVIVFFFGLVAIVTSNLASRVSAQAVVARERATMTENLYLFSRKLAGVFTLDDLLWAAAFQFAQMLKVRVVILIPQGETVAVRAGYPPEDTLNDADLAAAK